MSLTEEELSYLRNQRLARIGTVSPAGQPDVVPVEYEFDGGHLYVGDLDPLSTLKFRNVRAGSTKVALVIDDLAAIHPTMRRYLRIHGEAELVERRGIYGFGLYLRITPAVSWSFNVEGRPCIEGLRPRRTVHHTGARGERSAEAREGRRTEERTRRSDQPAPS